ncbi:hypothetical protein B9Z55_007940 [Caenorhabditis nigoni]|uniref:BTB domain-containing protein n=1 Tax=Caenorhabditis nigoni TaxID=1611254 RepID=A0A2G5VBZ8_9PELO|nr:hypothetical protein B9Z55_007940 [Caenorhabditis nigoni]
MSTERKFVMKHVFKDVMNLEEGRFHYGHRENHFGCSWMIQLYNSGKSSQISLDWCKYANRNAEIRYFGATKLLENGEIKTFSETVKMFNSLSSSPTLWKASESKPLENYLVDGDLSVEIEIIIYELTGVRTKNSKKFDDETAKKFSDVVLDVNGKKFYVNKMFLASHSSYFDTLFLGNFQESEKSEIELKDIDSWDFQNFLDLIYGITFVDDDTVEGILKLADMYDSQTARFRCQDFLIVNSERSLTEKFSLALRFKLEELKKKFLSDVQQSYELRRVIPSDHTQLDTSVWKELLLKSLDLLLEKERKFGV